MNRSIIAASFILALAAATPASADTLPEALAKAYASNPDLAAAQAELRAVDEQAPQALSGFRPTVSANASASVVHDDSQFSGKHDYSPHSAALQIQQPLYRGGRTLAAVNQADSLIAAQRATLKSTEQKVLLTGIQAYLDVMRDEAVLKLTKENEQVLQQQRKASKDRFSVGEVTKTDVSQSEARLSGATALRVQAEGSLTSSRAAYQRLFGDAPTRLTFPTVAKSDLPSSLDDALATASKNNPNLIAATYNRSTAEAALDSVKGERLPTLTAQGTLTHSYDSGSALANRDDSATAGLSLNIPLYQAGAVSSRIREAKQTVAQRDRERDSAERQAIEAVTSAWQDMETAKATRESRQSQVDASRIALDGVKQEAYVGSRSVLDTLNAEQEYLDARIGLVRSEHDETLAHYQALSAMGQLTAKDLQLPVSLYDETANAKRVRHQWIGSSVK